MGQIKMVETQNTRLNGLMIRLRQLESEREIMNKKELGILEQINLKESRELKEENRPTREDLVVTFVKEIEKAFFEFSEFLKRDSGLMKQDKDEFASFKRLVDNGIHHTYTKLDFKDIMEAVEGWWHGCAVLNPEISISNEHGIHIE